MSEAAVGWCAGLFDGEGCISLHTETATGKHRLFVRMAMGSREAIDRFREIVGSGTVREFVGAPPRKPHWMWVCAALDRERVLRLLRPYLVVKAAEADVALAFMETASSADRAWLVKEMRTHKSKPGNRSARGRALLAA